MGAPEAMSYLQQFLEMTSGRSLAIHCRTLSIVLAVGDLPSFKARRNPGSLIGLSLPNCVGPRPVASRKLWISLTNFFS